MLSNLVHLQNTFSAQCQQCACEVCIPQLTPSHGHPSYKSRASDPFPGTWTGTLQCRSEAQTGCTAVPTQPTKKNFLYMTGTTTNHCINPSQYNFKFYLNSHTASLSYINFTVYDATISPILREHQYFRTVNQCVWFYFKKYPPNSRTTFKTAS